MVQPRHTEALTAPELPTGTIDVQAPPDQPEAGGMGNILATALPMMGSMGVMVFMALSNTQNTRMLLMGGAMVVAMLSMVGINIYRQVGGHRRKVDTLRREYLAYLAETRDTVRTVVRKQHAYIGWHMPPPDALVLIAHEGSRLWERESADQMALHVRLGTSSQELAMALVEPELGPLAAPDVVCHSAMRRFIDTHASVDDVPFGVLLGDFSHLEVAGDPDMTRAEVRAMALHMATFTSPDLLRVAVLCAEQNKAEWDWLKWLPHARSQAVSDAVGPARMVTTDPAELSKLLGDEFLQRNGFRTRTENAPWPHLFLVVDGAALPTSHPLGRLEGVEGVTVVKVLSTWGPMTSRTTMRMILRPGSPERPGDMELLLLDQQPILAAPDAMGLAQAETVARRMAPWMAEERPETESPVGRSDPKRSQDLMELLGLGDIRDFDPALVWRRRDGRERLNVPFAVTPEGVPVFLDIKESAQQGMGPHGLLIGATGSGKSEVLRTVVLAMALTHSPDQLNFVLVDFKGGATFAGMADLPHVSAMISNLESELSLVDRMQDALRGEMVRRQEVLRQAGNYANVTDYEADRVAGKHNYPPLPALFIILDEFSELLSAKPEFVDLFVAIGRLGRSMSIHLLLSSQRLEAGRLKGLDSHLSYRIGLRTFSAGESRDVLGVPDAYELPAYPGVGYLKSGTDQMTRFRASYVAAPPPPRKGAPVKRGTSNAPVVVLPFTAEPVASVAKDEPPRQEPTGPIAVAGDERWVDKTQLDIAVAQMRGKGTPAHQVWLPPLDVPDTMDSLMDDLTEVESLGLISKTWRAKGPLRIPLGIVDVPLEQRRDVLEFDFSGANGHFGVVGGPLSGKSTTLRSAVMALSLVHTPQEVSFYIIDLGGGTFTPFDGAAHIAGLATRDRPDVVNRMLAEVEGIIADREKYFRANRIDSMDTYRQGRAEGRYDDGYGDVFLVIDGWAAMKTDLEGMDLRIMALMARALSFGVHVMVASNRWADFRQQVADAIGSRLELRLGDVIDTKFNRKVASSVPMDRPGRGQEVGTHHVLVALPRVDGDHSPSTLGKGVTDALSRIAQAAPAPGPKLRMLPTKITVPELLKLPGADRGLVLGVEESRLGPYTFDPANESHLFLFGDAKSGKSTFLRVLAQEIMRTRTPDEAQFFIVDYRRSLLGQVQQDYMASYMTNAGEATEQLGALAQYLNTRIPSSSVTPEQLRNRSWWRGAEGWVLVDDYDLVAVQGGNPVGQLQPLLAQAQDVGLHVVITRRMGGASRATYEPVLQSIRDLGSTGILLSGSPDEGAVIGRVKPVKARPGRAQVISRDAGRFIAQLAWAPSAN